MRNFICECRVRRCGGTENEVLFKKKVLGENRPLSRDTIELLAMFIELTALGRVSDTGEGVCQRVFRSGDPLGNESELVLDSLRCDGSGHPQASVISRSAVSEEKICGLVICVDRHFVSVPAGSPDVDSGHMSEEFKIGDSEFLQVFGCWSGEILVVGMVVCAQTGFILVPSVRGGVQ